jgi:hypothetical protein
MHCNKNFPFHKQKSDIDVALDPETGDETFLSLLAVSKKFNIGISL